jgi:hypothetical protein
MAIQIKDVGTLQAKYLNRAGGAVADYKAGVMAPKASQSASAIAAAPLWQQAVNSPAALAAFKKNLSAAGDAGWQNGAMNKGATNYPNGVRLGAPKWAANVAPYLQTISGLTLPAKGIKGSDANVARVSAVAQALHAKKVSMAGG